MICRRIALLLAALSAPSLAFAQTSMTSAGEVRDPATASQPAQPDDVASDWGFRWDDGHPQLRLGPSATIHFRGRVQLDSRGSQADIGDGEGLDVSRRRFGIEGEVGDWLDFQIEREFDSGTPWRDVYANYTPFDSLAVQAGRFKLPFSLDENTSSANLDFVYRSLAASMLAPGRDRGAMVHGRAFERVIGYELGVFTGDGDNARPRDDVQVSGGRTIAARLIVQPLRNRRSPMRDLQVGVAATGSDVPEGIDALRGRTALDGSFFPADLWVRGARRRLGVELRWRPGPASVKAEYIRATTERRGQSIEDGDLSDLTASGWYVSGTYLITGERKSAGGSSPRRPVFRGGYGALELAARLERLRFGSAADGADPSLSPRADVVFGNADRATTLGLNWFPMRGIKVQANLIYEAVSDPARSPLPDKPGFWSRVVRLQLSI